VKETIFSIKQHLIRIQKDMKTHFKAVALHKIQLSKKKVKLNKKKQTHRQIHLKKKEKIQCKLVKEMMERFRRCHQRKTN
jgi:hypothetical protein